MKQLIKIKKEDKRHRRFLGYEEKTDKRKNPGTLVQLNDPLRDKESLTTVTTLG